MYDIEPSDSVSQVSGSYHTRSIASSSSHMASIIKAQTNAATHRAMIKVKFEEDRIVAEIERKQFELNQLKRSLEHPRMLGKIEAEEAKVAVLKEALSTRGSRWSGDSSHSRFSGHVSCRYAVPRPTAVSVSSAPDVAPSQSQFPQICQPEPVLGHTFPSVQTVNITAPLVEAKSVTSGTSMSVKTQLGWSIVGGSDVHPEDFVATSHKVLAEHDKLQSVEEVKEPVGNSVKVCQAGNLRPHKIVTNTQEFSEAIPESEEGVAHSLKFEPSLEVAEHTLDVTGSASADSSQFFLSPKENSVSCHRILSSVASILDPLNLIALSVLVAKQILQEMCRTHLGWDEPPSEALCERWATWKKDLLLLKELSVSRCYKPSGFDEIVTSRLQTFFNARSTVYGHAFISNRTKFHL